MARTARLLELLIALPTRARFTVQELADEFGVSRRTMLRDLHDLAAMGVPLRATSGPGGGYALPRGWRRHAPALTTDEALALIVGYEALRRHAASPFAESQLAAVTKLRAALPPDAVRELDALREHVAILDPEREYDAPLLGDLLRAAVARMHLRIVYESVEGSGERIIFPYGIFAFRGFWYCACHDDARDRMLTLRADRVCALEPIADRPPRPHIPPTRWRDEEAGDAPPLRLRAMVTTRGAKLFEVGALFGAVAIGADGCGMIEMAIPPDSVEYWAGRLLGLGGAVRVAGPAELLAAMRRRAEGALGVASVATDVPDRAGG